MPWAKLDDRFHDNPKIRKAWRACPASIGLHVMAITYSAGNLLDGRVPAEFVEDQIPNVRARQAALDALTAGEPPLWHQRADGEWEINDYLAFNPSKADVEAKRQKAAASGRLGGKAKAALPSGSQA